MRIAHLTPGTGSYYCGTCLRDQVLVRALRARGHDVPLVPMYLPTFTGGEDEGEGEPIRMGAINLYLQQKMPVCRLLPNAVTHLLDSPALLRWVSKRAGGTTDPHFLGQMTLSMLKGIEGRLAPAVEKMAEQLAAEEPYDVILLSNALLCGFARPLHARTGAAIVCTLQGESPFLDALPSLHRENAWRTLAACTAHVDGFVAVSQNYADLMCDRLGLAKERVAVVLNGTDLEDFPARTDADDPPRPTIGFLSRMCADKGLPLLVDAFLLLRERGRVPDAALVVTGVELADDKPLVADLRARIATADLTDDVTFRPNVEPHEKWEFLRALSVLSVPATEDESFGMYLLEAMAAGVPVVQPRHAAFPEILAATGGGLLCEPQDPVSLADALERLLLHPAEARRLGEAGRQAVRERFTADRMAADVEKQLEAIVAATDHAPPR